MDTPATLSHRPTLRFWGWGRLDEDLTDEEAARVRAAATRLGAAGPEIAPPRLEDFDLAPPRVAPPATLAGLCSATPYDRLTHTLGKSFGDIARWLLRDIPRPPDLVAFPRSEAQVAALLDWASGADIAVVPFGGGTSVVGGIEPDVGDSYAGALSLDLQHLNQVLEVDRKSRAARIQAGALGPELEAQLRPHGLTLRHFPQSLTQSTLGGWIATRSGGHYASLYTHIDDFVEATRTVTPAGVLETRRLPGSGAGPAPDRLIIGSEGVLGVITEAWMRLQDRPLHQASASIAFDGAAEGAAAVRALAQSALFPTNCRLLDPAEAAANGAGDGREAILVLGFESADHPVGPWMQRALELAGDLGGRWDKAALERQLAPNAGEEARRAGAAGVWRNAFIRMPFGRNLSVGLGLIGDTFETAITWDRFDDFYQRVRSRAAAAIKAACGHEGRVSCRFTHVYPDGPAPYFSWQALGSDRGDIGSSLARWREIKRATNAILIEEGGTITHHHAVGRDHRAGYEAEVSPFFRAALAAAKQTLDPAGVLNPGVLIDPADRPVGARGVLGG
ncbi:MAG TPA: FAD-binding oxidoreductase [Caulobacteraceae bacterium]|nr:FAD-binding oxidoreductase [Caulobacteraceae bacterium]